MENTGFISFEELDGGAKPVPPTNIFSKLIERVRGTLYDIGPSTSQPQQAKPLKINTQLKDNSSQTIKSNETGSQKTKKDYSRAIRNLKATVEKNNQKPLQISPNSPNLDNSNNRLTGYSLTNSLPNFLYNYAESQDSPSSSHINVYHNSNSNSFYANEEQHRRSRSSKYIKSPRTFSDDALLSSSEEVTEVSPQLKSNESPIPSQEKFYNNGNGSSTSLFTSKPGEAMSNIFQQLQGRDSNDSSRDFWMKDEHCHNCYHCYRSFNPIFRRKHHCRICGLIFCADCASNMISGDILGQSGLIRVCDYCFRLRESYQQNGGYTTKSKDEYHEAAQLRNQVFFASSLNKERINEEIATKSPNINNYNRLSDDNTGLKKLLTAGTRVAMDTDSRHDSNNGLQDGMPHKKNVTQNDNINLQYSSDNLGSSISIPIASEPAPNDENRSNQYKPLVSDRDDIFSMINGFKATLFPDSNKDNSKDKPELLRSNSLTRKSLMQQNATSPNAKRLMRKLTVTSVDQESPELGHRRSRSSYGVQLNVASLQHLRRLLKQMLSDHQIPEDDGWEDIINSLVLKASYNLEVNVKSGDNMDVRRYIKIKKIPGGIPQDSEYIHGIVCSKNLAHKMMPRYLQKPRILILTFPIEYQRVEQQYISIEPVLAQESEHLKNMVARVLALRPTLVIVEKGVSRIALDFLLKANLCVAMNVKRSVIKAVARCTQAEIIPSLDKLWLEPKLGECQNFEVITYMHELIPSWRKSYLFFRGCKKSLGCTLILRGKDINTLKKLKRITELMIYAAYSLKLETVLLRDQLAKIPGQLPPEPEASQPMSHETNNKNVPNYIPDENDVDIMTVPYKNRILSTSPFVKYPVPYLLLKMKEDAASIKELKEKHQTTPASDALEINSDTSSPVSSIDEVSSIGYSKKDHTSLIDEQVQRLRTNWTIFESFQPPLTPFSHQSITILYCNVSIVQTEICQPPQSYTIEFYQNSDLTLGQFLELSCFDLSVLCGNCDKSVVKHIRSYVHDKARVTVTVEELPSPIAGMEGTILMWSFCKICDKILPVVPMAEETWKFSLGKYLELTFYHEPISCRADLCPHDILRDHIRYFGLNDLAARFEYETVDLVEVDAPATKLYFNPDIAIKLKDRDYEHIMQKIDAYWDSVNIKVKTLLMYSISAQKTDTCRQELAEMARRVGAERSYVMQILQQTYLNSHQTDTLALNLVLRVMQEKVVEWDEDLSNLIQRYLQTEKDFRQLTSQQLRKLFPERELGIRHVQFLEDFSLDDNIKSPPGLVIEGQLPDANGPAFPILGSSPTDQPERCYLPDILDNCNNKYSYTPIMNPRIYRRYSLQLMQQEKSRKEEKSNLVSQQHHNKPITPLITAEKNEDYLTSGTHKIDPKHAPSVAMGLPMLSRQNTGDERSNALKPIKLIGATTVTKNLRQQMLAQSSFNAHARNMSLPKLYIPSSKYKQGSPNSAPATKILQPLDSKSATPSWTPKADKSIKARYNLRSLERRKTEKPTGAPSSLASSERSLSDTRPRRSNTVSGSRPSKIGKPTIEVYHNAQEAINEESDSDSDEDDTPVESRPLPSQLLAGLIKLDEGPSSINLGSSGDELNLVSRPKLDSDLGFLESSSVEDLSTTSPSHSKPSKDLLTIPEEKHKSGGLMPYDASKAKLHAEEVTTPTGGYDRSSIIQTLSTFLGGTNPLHQVTLDYPLNPTEHIFADSPVIIREDEPSSIIAFTLSSQDYLDQIYQLRARANSSGSDPDDDSTSVLSDVGEQYTPAEVERTLKSHTGTHLRYQLAEGAIKLSCKIFFAHHFDALRFHVESPHQRLFIESLARCVKWSASGGKSGSIFLKTRDDRLVMKEVSKAELDAFLKFAPVYFNHLAEAFFEGLPIMLAKIFGLYRISIKNIHTGRTMKIDVLIMEYLFYERTLSLIFDLKGSMRNRHVQITGKGNEVLMDENLMERICKSPIFIRAHAKRLLHMAIFNDTKFLSSLKVMDYSLLAGIDEQKQKLVVGVVDFIRTFTWDKKLESWVKETGILGGGFGEKPTIVSPSNYKHRFRSNMEKYFLMVPDKYYVPSIELRSGRG